MNSQGFIENENKILYYIISKISSGATCLCMLGRSPSNETLYSIKIYENKEVYEKDKYFSLSLQGHPSFLSLLDFGMACYSFTNYNKVKVNRHQIYYEVFEYCENGDLYNFLNRDDKLLPVSFIKKLSMQIISGIKYMHNKNIAHFDIKPQNILIDNNYNAKIIDFGSSQQFKDKKENYKGVFLGTKLFCSREYKYTENKGVNLFKFDIFSLGVTLFCLFTKKNPFLNYSIIIKENGTCQENGYSYIIKRRKDKFWESYNYVPESSKDLIFRMLTDKENERISLDEVINHSFFKQEIYP